MVSWTMRISFSIYHVWAAEHFAQLAQRFEERASTGFHIEHRAYVTNSLLSSVAFLETVINEFIHNISAGYNPNGIYDHLAPEARQRLETLWRDTNEGRKISILKKYTIALESCGCEPLREEYPLQDCRLLIGIRNEIIHHRPVTLGPNETRPTDEGLAHRFGENPLMASSHNPYWPDKCLGSPCAFWALNASKALADQFHERVGVEPGYQRLEGKWPPAGQSEVLPGSIQEEQS